MRIVSNQDALALALKRRELQLKVLDWRKIDNISAAEDVEWVTQNIAQSEALIAQIDTLIQNTIEYYAESPRAEVNDGRCECRCGCLADLETTFRHCSGNAQVCDECRECGPCDCCSERI